MASPALEGHVGAEAAELFGVLSSSSQATLLYRNRRALLVRVATVSLSGGMLAAAVAGTLAVASSVGDGALGFALTALPLFAAAIALAALAKLGERYVLAVRFQPQDDQVLLSTPGLLRRRRAQLHATELEGARYIPRIGRGRFSLGPWLTVEVADQRRLVLDLDAEIEDEDFLEFVLGGLLPDPPGPPA